MDTNRVHAPEQKGDTLETNYSSLENLNRPHGCYEGFVYIGHIVEDEHGDEVEVFEAVPCRVCNAARETSYL